MPDVAGDAGEKDRGVTPFEPAHHRHLGDGMALPVIFAKEECVDPGGVAAHDHVLIVVGKNLRLDEITGTQQVGHGASLANGAKGAFPETFAAGARVTSSGRSERKRLWPSITSGSRSLMSAVSRLSAARSDSSALSGSTTISSSQPVLSDSATLMSCSSSDRTSS